MRLFLYQGGQMQIFEKIGRRGVEKKENEGTLPKKAVLFFVNFFQYA
jgi:hypothetical protein